MHVLLSDFIDVLILRMQDVTICRILEETGRLKLESIIAIWNPKNNPIYLR